MLSERKRFNYNVGTNPTVRSRSKSKLYTPSISAPLSHLSSNDQNLRGSKVAEIKENPKRVEQLQALNKKLVEETTLQFKRLQSDVQRVERILQEKQVIISQLQQSSKVLQEQSIKAQNQKKLLIQAILEKDLVINQYEQKLKEFLETKQAQTQKIELKKEQCEAQTDPLPESWSRAQLKKVQVVNSELSDELYQVRQQLFDAQNRIKLITQQFEAYKVLKEIERIQQI